MDIKEFFPEEFWECEVLYADSWSDYEEWGFLIIFKFFDEIMCCDYQYCVFSEDNTFVFDPIAITEDEMKTKITEFQNVMMNSFQ